MRLFIIAAIAAGLSPNLAAQESSETDAVRRLEKRVAELESKLSENDPKPAPTSRSPGFTDATSDPRQGGARPGYEFGLSDRPTSSNFRLGGYFSVVYREAPDGGASVPAAFDQHRLVLQVGFDIAKKLSFNSEIEYEGGGADVPFLTGQEILVEYAEAEFKLSDWFKPKAGLILIPFGRFNLVHDDPLHDLFDRPFVARRVVPSAFDQPGVGVAGDAHAPGAGFFSYNLAVTQGFRDNFTANGGSRDARQSFRADDNSNKAFWGRASFRPDWESLAGFADSSLEVGISGTHQKIGAADHTLTGWGVDGAFRWNSGEPFGIDAEGEYAEMEIDRDPTTGITGLSGYYGQVTLRFRPWDDGDCDGWLRDSGYIGLVARWEENNLDDRTVGAAMRDDREALTVGIAFRPFFKTVIRAEWKMINSQGIAVDESDRFVLSLSTYF